MTNTSQVRAVVAHAGARDHYQVPLALQEISALERFVTDFYAPLDSRAFSRVVELAGVTDMFRRRFSAELPSSSVSISPKTLLCAAGSWLGEYRWLVTQKDYSIGKYASRVARKHEAALLSYSYYAYFAFHGQENSLPYRFLFQVHPHPGEVRKILLEELELVPMARQSLEQEVELRLSNQEFERLVSEPELANGWVVASTFTAKTLSAQGIPLDQIHIVPYGVDSRSFPARRRPPSHHLPFTVIFVGSMIQRKGLSYLLSAIRLLHTRSIRVVLIGRGYRDETLLREFRDLWIEIYENVPRADLVAYLHGADIMVLPSLVEGFAHVILESLSCGLPVLTTQNTCGPDILADGEHGFIVPIRDDEGIAEKLAWAIENRSELGDMGVAAARQARQFTWSRFRAQIRNAYCAMITNSA